MYSDFAKNKHSSILSYSIEVFVKKQISLL